MRVQTARRAASLPPHYGNGAIEAPLADVRQMLERRKWTFRSQARMILLLELGRLRINGHDDSSKWAALIRTHIETNGGQSEWRRRMADTRSIDPTTGAMDRYDSLSA